MHDAAAASPASGRRRPTCCALLAGQRDQPVARELRPRAGRLLDAVRAAGARRGARRLRARARARSQIEANAATDNPMVFADRRGDIVSGGNFHGAPVAIAADLLVLGLLQLATITRAARRSAGQSGAERPRRRSSRATAGCTRAT